MTGFDASFTTGRIYRVNVGTMSVELVEERLERPFTKRYPMQGIGRAIEDADLAVAAEEKGEIVGFATVKFETWNRRAMLTHLYVRPENRGCGIGTALIREAIRYAKCRRARCLWLETQNVNFPAIRFYKNLGFRFCGFDQALYNPRITPDEIALYFCLDL